MDFLVSGVAACRHAGGCFEASRDQGDMAWQGSGSVEAMREALNVNVT